MKALRKLYDWVMGLAEHPRAMPILAFVSFIESSIFPIPPDVMILPMGLKRPQKAWIIAFVATVSSVLGGVFGYLLGYVFFDVIGGPILSLYGYDDKFATFQTWYLEWGIWIVLFAGLTPFPYKVITITSGLMAMNLPLFIFCSILARGARFFLVAALIYFFGEKIRLFIERYLGLLTFAFFALLFGGFLLLKVI